MFAREFFGNKNGKNSNAINYEFQKLCKKNIHRKVQDTMHLIIFNNSLECAYGPFLYINHNLFSAVAKLMNNAKILVKTSEEL